MFLESLYQIHFTCQKAQNFLDAKCIAPGLKHICFFFFFLIDNKRIHQEA